MSLRSLLAPCAARVFNTLLTALHNGVNYHLTREEIRYAILSFSQFGEDLAVKRIAEERRIDRGFYVDCGAFHPIHCSNTLLLHKNGWRGVNIDLSPDKLASFCQLRPEDQNVQAILSNSNRPVFALEGDNGLCDRLVESPNEIPAELRSLLRPVTTQTLTQVLEQQGITPRRIDYLNIDCEGHDLSVLQGLDLTRYPVEILTIEALTSEAEAAIRDYATAHGFTLREKICWTLVFTR